MFPKIQISYGREPGSLSNVRLLDEVGNSVNVPCATPEAADRLAAAIRQWAAGEKDPAAVALGRKGGKKGGPARAAKLTSTERSESARKAVQARWAKVKQTGVVVGT